MSNWLMAEIADFKTVEILILMGDAENLSTPQ
jgi:hypothetical protein